VPQATTLPARSSTIEVKELRKAYGDVKVFPLDSAVVSLLATRLFRWDDV
jgi:hypothetical protein